MRADAGHNDVTVFEHQCTCDANARIDWKRVQTIFSTKEAAIL